MRKLADEISEAQREEIAEMKYLIRALQRDGAQAARTPQLPVEPASIGEALRAADVAKTDLEPISPEELQRTLGPGSVCRFSYAPDGRAVAAAVSSGPGGGRGVIKLHGRLVVMTARFTTSESAGFELSADGVTVTAAPYQSRAEGAAREADARFQVGQDLDVGYGGFYSCTSSR